MTFRSKCDFPHDGGGTEIVGQYLFISKLKKTVEVKKKLKIFRKTAEVSQGNSNPCLLCHLILSTSQQLKQV